MQLMQKQGKNPVKMGDGVMFGDEKESISFE